MLLSKVDFVTDGWSDRAGDGAAALPVGGVRVTVDAPEASGFDYRMDLLANRLEMQTATKVPVRMCSWLAVDENLLVTELTTGDMEFLRDRAYPYLNPPSDVAFVDLTFRLLLRYSELLNVDADRRALWRDIQAHLPQYKVISYLLNLANWWLRPDVTS